MIIANNKQPASSPSKKTIKLDQQTIVFLLFVVIFSSFSILLPGFLSVGNLVATLRSIAVLGILGIAMAIASSFKNRAIDDGMVAFGEIGLSGEVRAVSMVENRIAEAKKLGFTTCILPSANKEGMKKVDGIKLIGVSNVREAVESIKEK